jgi:DNA-directed RNA polymerase subunit beta'
LLGLKENIIIGHLIPAGTGMYRYQEVEVDLGAPEGMELPPLPAAEPAAASPLFAFDEDEAAERAGLPRNA